MSFHGIACSHSGPCNTDYTSPTTKKQMFQSVEGSNGIVQQLAQYCFEKHGLQNSAPEPTTDSNRTVQQYTQYCIGKLTPEYVLSRLMTSPEQRTEVFPFLNPPDSNQPYSVRKFEKGKSAWRRALHYFDSQKSANSFLEFYPQLQRRLSAEEKMDAKKVFELICKEMPITTEEEEKTARRTEVRNQLYFRDADNNPIGIDWTYVLEKIGFNTLEDHQKERLTETMEELNRAFQIVFARAPVQIAKASDARGETKLIPAPPVPID